MDQGSYENLKNALRDKFRREDDDRTFMKDVIVEIKRQIAIETTYNCCAVGRVVDTKFIENEFDGAGPGLRFAVEIKFGGAGRDPSSTFYENFTIEVEGDNVQITRMSDSLVIAMTRNDIRNPEVMSAIAFAAWESIDQKVQRVLSR